MESREMLMFQSIKTICDVVRTWFAKWDLGHFGDAVSATLFRRRDVSAMAVADVLYEKMCVFEIL